MLTKLTHRMIEQNQSKHVIGSLQAARLEADDRMFAAASGPKGGSFSL